MKMKKIDIKKNLINRERVREQNKKYKNKPIKKKTIQFFHAEWTYIQIKIKKTRVGTEYNIIPRASSTDERHLIKLILTTVRN